MKLKHVLPFMVFSAMPIMGEAQKVLQTGIELKDLDTRVKPGEDFYEFACGGWAKEHPLTAEYSRYGTFEELIENNNMQLRGLIEELSQTSHPAGTLQQKIGDLYNIAMDSVKQNKDGYAPIQEDLKKIAAVQSRKDILPVMAGLMKKGVSGYFGFYIAADVKDSKMNLLQIYQGGLSLGEKEYYWDEDEATLQIREAFKQHVKSMFMLCGFTESDATRKMEAVMDIETRIAGPSYSATQQRDPEANYHKMTFGQLKQDYAGVDWKTFFDILGIHEIEEISVSQPEPIHEVEKILAEVDVESQKAFLEWKLIDASASYLSDALRTQNFSFMVR